jgi:hypothetical protein
LPPFAPVGGEVLEPVPDRELSPHPAGESEPGDAYLALASLVDARVKRRTNVAALAALSVSGLAVLIFFGVR